MTDDCLLLSCELHRILFLYWMIDPEFLASHKVINCKLIAALWVENAIVNLKATKEGPVSITWLCKHIGKLLQLFEYSEWILQIKLKDWLHEPRDHVVTPSFKPASLNPKTASCTLLHLFHLLCASQKVTKICRNVFPVVHAISQNILSMFIKMRWRYGPKIVCPYFLRSKPYFRTSVRLPHDHWLSMVPRSQTSL